MDVSTIGGLIGSLGFPIVCVVMCAWFIKYMYDNSREDVQKANKTIDEMVLKYSDLSNGLNNNTEAVKNQTELLLKIIEKIGDVNE